MDENNYTQSEVENGGVQVSKESKKKWSIPRVSSGPMCYSMFEWAFRLSLSDMLVGGGLAFLFFYLRSNLDENKESYSATNTALIIFGLIFCLVCFFGLVLCTGLCSNKLKVLLLVYCWYAAIMSIIIFVLFFASGIYIMVNSGEIGLGFGGIFIGVILSAYYLYIGCLIYSIHMNIVENKEEINLKKGGC